MEKKTMSVPEMRKILGMKKTESYWLIKKGYFRTVEVCGKIRIDFESFENWYENQFDYHKTDGSPPGKNIRDLYYGIAEISERLCVSRYTVFVILDRNKIRKKKIGKRIYAVREDFDAWYTTQTEYLTEDQQKNLISMADMARDLGMDRKKIYGLVRKYEECFEFVYAAGSRKITRESYQKFLLMQNRYTGDGNRNRRYISRKEAAKMAAVSESTVSRWISGKYFEVVYIYGNPRINREDYIQFLKERRKEVWHR